jgi:hypothetical protein
MKLTYKVDRRCFLGRAAFLAPAWLPQGAHHASGEYAIALSTWPHRIYKENDGLLQPAPTESCVFNLVVKGQHNRAMDTVSARLEFYSSGEVVHVSELSRKALQAIRGVSIATRNTPDREEELFDFRHYFSLPVSLDVDRLAYTLTLMPPGGSEMRKRLEIPLLRYEGHAKLIFPMKGKCWIGLAHDFNEPHSDGRSQHFAYDILGVGPNWEIVRGAGAANSDFYTWGRQVIAPADAKVLYARNDVPDNPGPGRIDKDLMTKLPDPDNAIPGNNITLDHGSGEYSSLGHMRQGSVRVKTGDHVKQGDVLGEVGSAGDSMTPHLHYQLCSGDRWQTADGLPSRFDNISFELFQRPIPIPTPKRGFLLIAH